MIFGFCVILQANEMFEHDGCGIFAKSQNDREYLSEAIG